jgi:methyltransferase (TIGR00027 family)
MRKLLSFLVFIPLQIAFIPFAMVGFVIAGYRQIQVSKRLGVSSTAIEVIGGRWTMHIFGLREDRATARLMRALPNASPLGLWLFLFPLWVKQRIAGESFLYPRVPDPGRETLADLIVVRTLHFDELLESRLGDVEQLVVLGAGFDTRAYSEPRREGLRWFEVDQPAVQAVKRDALARAGIGATHVVFVAADFSSDDAFDLLERAGYDPRRRTLFLWEGVTLYLGVDAVRRTLRQVRARCGRDSLILADVYGQRFVDFASLGLNRKALEYTNEVISFGLPFETDPEGVLDAFVGAEGLARGRTRFLGAAHRKGPYGAVVEFEIPADEAITASDGSPN